jgi:hypothetical protein
MPRRCSFLGATSRFGLNGLMIQAFAPAALGPLDITGCPSV